ncbi:ARM repeat-containing protein [Cristinia sonorae]|uniref:ARM repeat-containing protein n=1 Tax=Cristinia sonorae TaxID=1940300 RepID=A0A8K0XNF7_9AGAR|nr:ARM repeat-containing protein [Cristinia sonorae]
MDTSISKQLVDKMYEKRKAAALELEKQIRECHQQGDHRRISQIVDQLVDMFSNPSNALQARNGGLIGLAGTAIALGVDISPYMEKFVSPLLVCFTDPENRVRYFSAECLYNIAKVSKGEILVYFNDIFDALSKLAADSELSVKNGAELLDRLLKDIVAETASVYVPQYPETEKARRRADEKPSVAHDGVLITHPDDIANGHDLQGARKAFSLAHFLPLLKERIYVLSPFTRSYLVTWISVLDSVPELELISYLPEFLDGLLKYLSDPTEDVRIATENLLGEFLREIRDVTLVQRHHEEELRAKREAEQAEQQARRAEADGGKLPDITMAHSERAAFVPENDDTSSFEQDLDTPVDEKEPIPDTRDLGTWVPGLGVKIDYAAIVEILIQQLDDHPDHDEIQQSTALLWLSEFLKIAQEVMVPFTPRLILAILPNLAHHVPMIQTAAKSTNKLLLNVIRNLPPPSESSGRQSTDKTTASTPSHMAPSSPSTVPPTIAPVRQTTGPTGTVARDTQPPESPPETNVTTSDRASMTSHRRTSLLPEPRTNTIPAASEQTLPQPSRPASPNSAASIAQVQQSPEASMLQEKDIFDYQATVNALTIQFLSEHEETRVAALKWLIMLHQKAPKKILAMDDGTFPALLKTLSDSSEEVIKHDLQLLAQISSSSEESYFKAFMMNLLELFSTDRTLLETRGSLIIRQLCLNLNTERIYRTFAEILEKEEDLDFASTMVRKLNMILITSPELSDFRRRLKSLETRQDGQALFTTLYRTWCHNAVAVFSLCLLAQAYEHASNLLYIFADLEITVQLLVQIDKLVQLIESPVFTYLRLQLLEPEKYPHLFKCLYGLLMLLPQSSAFVSLRNRLNAVNSAGFLHIAPKSTSVISATRSKLGGRDEIKWAELLSHFRSVQNKHEKSRRPASSTDDLEPPLDFPSGGGAGSSSSANPSARPPMRRKVTGTDSSSRLPPRALSPLNPRARGQGGLSAAMATQAIPMSPTFAQQKLDKGAGSGGIGGKRTLSLGRGK